MKKIIALLLIAILSFSLFACGGQDTPTEDSGTAEGNTVEETEGTESEVQDEENTEAEPQTEEVSFEVGKEASVKNFVFTVNEIGLSDSICIEKGDNLGLASKTGDSVEANEGYQWLYYSISYKFTGENNLLAHNQFYGSAKYGDSYFWEPNVRFFKHDDEWYGLDYMSIPVIGLPLPPEDDMYKYDPWVEKDYELHGAVQVPVKAVEDTETPLVLRFEFTDNDDVVERVSCITEF